MTPETQQAPQPKPLVRSSTGTAPNPFAASASSTGLPASPFASNGGTVGASFSPSAQAGYGGQQNRAGPAPADMNGINNPGAASGTPVTGSMPSSGGTVSNLFHVTGFAPDYSANPGVSGGTITQHELDSGQFDQTGPVQVWGPTAALYGVPNGGYYYGPGDSRNGTAPGSGTGNSTNAPANPAAPNPFGRASGNPFGTTSTAGSAPNPFAANPNGNPFGNSPASSGTRGTTSSVAATSGAPSGGTGAYAGSTVNGGTAPPPAIPYGNIQNTLDTSKVPGLVGGDALSLQMQAAQAAAYKQATAYLDPQWANAERDLQTQLANQGIPVGSDAYNRAVAEFQRNKAFAYSQAQQAAVQQGNAAQAQLFGEGLASNQNAFGQALSGGNFSNAAQNQITQQILANLGFNEGVSQNNFNNSLSTRQQDINELLLQQQNPLQMFQALTQGNGITTPNFTNTPGTNVNGTDIASIIAQALQQGNNVYNTQVGAQNSNTAAYATIIAALLSDRRFKRNVRMIGMHEVGVPLYAFDYVWGTPGIGVMADEVRQVKPSAVIELPNGMLAVNYAEFSEVA